MASTSPHATGFNGAAVRELRAELARQDMTAGDLADKLGMHPTVLSRYLNFKRALRLEDAEKIAEALGMNYLEMTQRAWAQRDSQ